MSSPGERVGMRLGPVLFAVFAVALAVGAIWWARRAPEPSSLADLAREADEGSAGAPDASRTGAAGVDPASAASGADAAPRSTVSGELGDVPVPPELRQRLLPADPDEKRDLPSKIEYPLDPKLAELPLSDVPHRVVGAWDEATGEPELGARRGLVLVVEPGLSDADLENLARDVLDRHRDAEMLMLRVFDSPEAAVAPSHLDGGAFPASHLVVELSRNPLIDEGIRLRVRGRPVEP